MKYFALALPFLALPGLAWADDACMPTRMSLNDERRADRGEPQDVETDRQRPDDSAQLTPMEFVYRHSGIEFGSLWTDYDPKLGLRSHLAFYLAYGVEIAPQLSVQLAYRFATFGNGPGATTPEDVRIQTLLVQGTYHVPLTPEFGLEGTVGIGPTWWDSTVVHNDVSFTVSGEVAVTAKFWEMLRLKLAVVVDGADTTFHQASGMSVNVSGVLGLEYGL